MISNPNRSFNPVKVLILGMGDLGVHIARLVVENQYSSACLLAGQSGAAEQWAQLLYLSTGRDVRGVRVDGQDIEALKNCSPSLSRMSSCNVRRFFRLTNSKGLGRLRRWAF